MYEPSRMLASFEIAGFSHWYGMERLSELKAGQQLELRGEPDNPYDPCAIAIYFDGTKLGYVPHSLNGELSTLLFFGHGSIFYAGVAQVNPEAHPEKQVRVNLYVKDGR